MALSKISNDMFTTISSSSSKPIIINGDQSVSQRTTSVSASDGVYCTDRIKHTLSNDGAATITQESLSSGNAFTDGFANALKIDVTTADGSLSAAQKYHFRYNIEGQDIQHIKKGTASAEKLTLAFWVKATKTGTNIVRCYTADSDRSCSVAYTVSSSDTWEKKILNFPADTSGTVIADDNTVGMTFTWALAGGSNFSSGTLATAWASNTSANDFVGQVNNLDSTSNNFHITGIQLEIGEFSSTSIPPFQHESYGDNFTRCLRYYQDDALYSNSGDTAIMEGLLTNDGGNFRHLWKQFLVPMRTAPTISDVNWRDDTGSSTSASTQQGSQLVTYLTADIYGRGNVGSGDSDTNSIYFHGATYSAEL